MLSHPASQDPALLVGLIKVGYAALQSKSWPWHLGHSHCQLLMAVALRGTTVAVRKSAILASVKGGLSDLVALDHGDGVEEGEPTPVTEPHSHCAWCIRRSALRCLMSISRTSDDAGIKALASRIVIARKVRFRGCVYPAPIVSSLLLSGTLISTPVRATPPKTP